MLQVIEHDLLDLSRRASATTRRERLFPEVLTVSQGAELRVVSDSRQKHRRQVRRLPPAEPNFKRHLLQPRSRPHHAQSAQPLDQSLPLSHKEAQKAQMYSHTFCASCASLWQAYSYRGVGSPGLAMRIQ